MRALQCDRCKVLCDFQRAEGWIILYTSSKYMPYPNDPTAQGIDLCLNCAQIIENEIKKSILEKKDGE